MQSAIGLCNFVHQDIPKSLYIMSTTSPSIECKSIDMLLNGSFNTINL